MSAATSPTHTAFRYMTRFRCIGPDCETSCCSGGWAITIDRDHVHKTRRALGGSPAGRQEFDAKVKLVKGVAQKAPHHALVVLQSNGDCSFLSEARLCTLQERYGEELLSDTCAVYPRAMALSGGRRELSGQPSCPEVSRQLLLHEDAMELVEVEPTAFVRPLLGHRLTDPAHGYTRYHDELRNLILDLLSDTAYPLSSQLSFVAYFANRTRSFLRSDSAHLDEPRLLAEVERIQDARLRRELHQQFEALAVDALFPQRVVLATVGPRAERTPLAGLLQQVVARYREAPATGVTQSEESAEAMVARMVEAYAHHKALWSHASPRIDGYLTNFAKSYWTREWYVSSPDLLTHTVKLLARIAVVRFLLLGHPLLAAALARSSSEQESALDGAIVEVVHKFSRAYDHNQSLRQRLQRELSEANLISLAHAICLARF